MRRKPESKPRVSIEEVCDRMQYRLSIKDSEIVATIERTNTVSTYPNKSTSLASGLREWFNERVGSFTNCRVQGPSSVLKSEDDSFKFHCIPSDEYIQSQHRRVAVHHSVFPERFTSKQCKVIHMVAA